MVIKLTDKVFTQQLTDSESTEFQGLANEVIDSVSESLKTQCHLQSDMI